MIRKLAIAIALGSALAMPLQAETYGVLMKTLSNPFWGAMELGCLLYTSPSPRDVEESRMPSSA